MTLVHKGAQNTGYAWISPPTAYFENQLEKDHKLKNYQACVLVYLWLLYKL